MAAGGRRTRPTASDLEVSFFLAPQAEEELADALAFYQDQASPSVAASFLAEFARIARLIAEHPGIGTPTTGARRIMPMPRFPYSLIYRVETDVVRIGAVAHQSRRPGYWRAQR